MTRATRQSEMLAALLALVPFGPAARFRAVELGSNDGRLSEAFLECFPNARLLTLAGSETARAATARRTERFSDRVDVRSFDPAGLDWWDAIYGADVVIAWGSVCLLNDAKKQYLFKAVAERLSSQGAMLIADPIAPQHPFVRALFSETRDDSSQEAAGHPSPLFFQLVWLKHAGFAVVDCFWVSGGHAVFGGFKAADATGVAPLTYAAALESVQLTSTAK